MKIFQFIFILLLILAAQGCKDTCKNVDCGNGVCKDGECICESGWEKDVNGVCVKQDLCFGKDCINGTCNAATGNCDCNPGWLKDNQGKCTIKDLCYQKNCGQGVCDPNSGSCICNNGYEVDAAGACNIDGRAKFLGTWRGTENCGADMSAPYNITITASAISPSKINISNFANVYCSFFTTLEVTATIIKNAAGSYVMANAFTTDCASVAINQAQTTISVSGNTMNITYSIIASGQTFNCTAVMIKQ